MLVHVILYPLALSVPLKMLLYQSLSCAAPISEREGADIVMSVAQEQILGRIPKEPDKITLHEFQAFPTHCSVEANMGLVTSIDTKSSSALHLTATILTSNRKVLDLASHITSTTQEGTHGTEKCKPEK
jgi:hypothetical protein